jgi:hypothetical protein
MDNETKKLNEEREKLKMMVESEAWGIVKERLLKRAATLLNLADISDLNPQTIVQLIGIRQETAKNLLSWMKEIEGDVNQHKDNVPTFKEISDEYIINL